MCYHGDVEELCCNEICLCSDKQFQGHFLSKVIKVVCLSYSCPREVVHPVVLILL